MNSRLMINSTWPDSLLVVAYEQIEEAFHSKFFLSSILEKRYNIMGNWNRLVVKIFGWYQESRLNPSTNRVDTFADKYKVSEIMFYPSFIWFLTLIQQNVRISLFTENLPTKCWPLYESHPDQTVNRDPPMQFQDEQNWFQTGIYSFYLSFF